ncbi:hypothetical protein NA57DRAFT_75909 [Rhizodiscina lignyota]|uniref:Uncharacterized protein n=1 Tax=Rhizodiscina lignyota TaxID=1504668 RepID=A0A9P4IHQ6_9PEZI|nr:hypothetical protein NA57DRAFT_75909 [Rhizodiscina lignyota]
MSGPEKWDEDRAILMETLSDILLFYYINRKIGISATDEFTVAVGRFKNQGRHTLALDFAAQIYLDIRHIFRGESGQAWVDFRQYARNAKASLEQNFELHEKLRIENWPRQNDEALRVILSKVGRLVEVDTMQREKAKLMPENDLPLHPPTIPHSFLIGHPWLCGSLLFGMKLDMQYTGTGFLNAWGSAKYTAQLYNAALKEKFLEKGWQDMNLALAFYGDTAMFAGSKPNDVEEYFKRFCLSMGYSAQNFARGGRRPHSRPIESQQGPRGGIEGTTISPVANELRFGYTSFEDIGRSVPDIKRVLEKCLKENDDFDTANTDPNALRERTQKQKTNTTPDAPMLICESLISEEVALTFDHFRLHRSCWLLLRTIKKHIDSEVKRIYGPGYMETENQLPFIVGYIFMTAVNTKKLGKLLLPKKEDVVSSMLLKEAHG